MSRRWIYAVVCIGSCLLPIINSAAGEVVLTAMKSHVKVGDPLFLRVTIHNKTDQAIAIYPALATEFYTILFGIRRAGVGEYQDVLAADQHPGTYGADNPEWIGPDKQRSAYAILFARDGKLVLDAPGNYELRVSVPYRKDEDRGRGLLTSEPIQVRVDPHSDEQMKLIHDSLPWLERVVGNFHVPNEPGQTEGDVAIRTD